MGHWSLHTFPVRLISSHRLMGPDEAVYQLVLLRNVLQLITKGQGQEIRRVYSGLLWFYFLDCECNKGHQFRSSTWSLKCLFSLIKRIKWNGIWGEVLMTRRSCLYTVQPSPGSSRFTTSEVISMNLWTCNNVVRSNTAETIFSKEDWWILPLAYFV